MTDLTPEAIAHLRELDAARTQGDAAVVGGGEYLLPFGIMVDPDEGGITDADADFIAMATNHMGALLDAAGERNQLRAAWVAHRAEVSRLRAELAEARAQIEQVTALLADRSVIGTLNGHEVPLPMVHKADLRDALAPATQREEGE